MDQLIDPVLRAVADLGGSGSVGEILDTVVKREGFTEEQQAVMHREGPETELSYRLGWARTTLKNEKAAHQQHTRSVVAHRIRRRHGHCPWPGRFSCGRQ